MLDNRIPPPLVALIFFGLVYLISLVTFSLELGVVLRSSLSLITLMIGFFFAISGIVDFRRAKTTVNPLKPEAASSLVSSGVYRISRNPMYVGLALLLLSWSLFLASPFTILGVIGFILYINKFQIKPEERALEDLFGVEFLNYKARVRRWI